MLTGDDLLRGHTRGPGTDIKEFEKIDRYWGRSSLSPPPSPGRPGGPERRVV